MCDSARNFFYCHPERREGSHKSWLITQSSLDVPGAVVRSLTFVRDDEQEVSENYHSIANAHQVLHARGVPVREANATVTCGTADCLGIVRAMNTNARLVQTHPKNADEVVRAGR